MTRLGIDDRTEGTTVDLVGPNRLKFTVFKTGVGIEIKHQTGKETKFKQNIKYPFNHGLPWLVVFESK